MSSDEHAIGWHNELLMRTYDNTGNAVDLSSPFCSAGKTNTQDGEADDGEAAGGVADNKTESARNASITPEVVFKVGDFARATYIDGIDYEGAIISTDLETGTCILRYCGYENEQEVLITDLMPSWGRKARREQFLQAKAERTQEQPQPRAKNISKKSTAQKKTGSGNGAAGSSLVVPPIPFVPPLMNPNGGNIDGEQDFVAMLTAWYMSGYYTGYYQGKKAAAAVSNKKNHSAAGAVKK